MSRWDVEKGTLRAVLAHDSSGAFATFSPEGRRLLTVGRDHLARVWDLRPLSVTGLRLPHESDVRHAEFSADGRMVLTRPRLNASLWDAPTGQALAELGRTNLFNGLVPWLAAARFTPSAQRYVMASKAVAYLFGSGMNPPRCLPFTTGDVFCAVFSPDGQRFATGSDDDWPSSGSKHGTAQVWDATSAHAVGPALKHDRPVVVCVFAPDGSCLATGSSYPREDTDESVIGVWDFHTGRLLSPRIDLRGVISDLRFDPSGHTLLSATVYPPLEEREAQIWDWRTGREVTPPLKHRDGVPHAEFSPDGRRVVTASLDTTAQIWDASTGRPLTPPLRHAWQVEDACFSPHGRRVATASSDGTARVWDAMSGEPLTPSLRHDGPVHSVRFSPDGLRLVTASEDHTVRIWELAKTQRPISDLLLIAALSSGQRLDRAGKLMALEPEELVSVWRTLKAKYPEDFSREP